MSETPEAEPQTQPARFRDILESMRAARDSFFAGGMSQTDYVNRIIELDRRLTLDLTGRFNETSGFIVTLPDAVAAQPYRATLTEEQAASLPSRDLERDIIQSLEQRTGRPAAFFAIENETASRVELLSTLMHNNPQLSGMTLSDAANLILKTSAGKSVEWKYGNTDETIVMSAALTMVNLRRNELRTVNPELSRLLERQEPDYVRQTVGARLMGKAMEDEEFLAWEGEHRDQVTAAIRRDEGLMNDIRCLRPLLDSQNPQDLLAQHRLRDSINQRVVAIFARVYDTPELLESGTTNTTYAPAEKLRDNDIHGYAGGVAGLNRDDYIMMRTSLYPELLIENPADTDREIGEKLLGTITEEARHAVDHIYTDRLVRGELDADHPAFRHSNLIFFNQYNYINRGTAYEQQYLERTAKIAAAEITALVSADIYPPEPAAPPAPGEAVELPGMTITGNARPK